MQLVVGEALAINLEEQEVHQAQVDLEVAHRRVEVQLKVKLQIEVLAVEVLM
tara:strand:- start:610 stop:765 length:156 start_codon:yes stop_codon:yes gene_type:complete